MRPSELIKILQSEEFKDDQPIICQVVDKIGNAWNMEFQFSKPKQITSLTILTVSHPDLEKLPAIYFGSGTKYPAN